MPNTVRGARLPRQGTVAELAVVVGPPTLNRAALQKCASVAIAPGNSHGVIDARHQNRYGTDAAVARDISPALNAAAAQHRAIESRIVCAHASRVPRAAGCNGDGAVDARDLNGHRRCAGAYEGTPTRLRLPSDMTFREFGGAWADGELNQIWPDHIDIKRSAADDLWRMKKHIFPAIGHLPVRDITLDHVDDVMSRLPRTLSKATRRHVAQISRKLESLVASFSRLMATGVA
jgi:hypothetical protein